MKHRITNRTKTLILLAQCALIAGMLLGVTYAFSGGGADTPSNPAIQRQVRVSDFDLPVGNWQLGETHPTKVYVKNLTPAQSPGEDPRVDSGSVCLRVSLKEFMQVLGTEGAEITDSDGNPILFATIGEGVRKGEYLTVAEAISLGLTDYGSYKVGEVEYATTNTSELRHGVYGKPMKALGDVVKQWGDTPKASITHGNQRTPNGACDYTPFLFGDSKGIFPAGNPADAIRNYIALGGADNVKLLSQWDGALGDFWLVDDTTTTGDGKGWVYWANRLPPQKSTSDLISELTLVKHPITAATGVFNYSMHVDLQATDESQAEIVGVLGDAGVTTLDDLAGKVTDEKFDLIEALVRGQHKVEFLPNLPQNVAPEKLGGMPAKNPQWVTSKYTVAKPGDPTLDDQRYRFKFWSTNKDASPTDAIAAFDFSAGIKADTNLYAVWQQGFRFKMKVDDNNNLLLNSTAHPDYKKPRQVTLNVLNFYNEENDFIVDWGAPGHIPTGGAGTKIDNTYQVQYTGTIDAKTVKYEYTGTGTFTIEIWGTMPGSMRFSIDAVNTSAEPRLKQVLTPCLPSLQTTFRMFQNCTGLAGTMTSVIPTNVFKNNPQVTYFFSAFGNCSGLTGTIPEGLFENNSQVISFASTFENCSGLTGTIPEKLFEQNKAVTSFFNTFYNCSRLTGTIPEKLFEQNKEVKSFSQTFVRCSGLTGTIPEKLFEQNKAVTSFYGTFWGCTQLTGTIPEKLFEQNKAVTTFYATFYKCSGLTGTIPEKLFAGNPNVTIFSYTFSDCPRLTGTIPEKLFAGNPKVTGFSYTFYDCRGVKGPVPTLWISHPNATGNACFRSMTQANITNWSSIPPGWK